MLHAGCIHNTSRETGEEITTSGCLAAGSPPSLQPAAKINSSEMSFNFTVESRKKILIIPYKRLAVKGGKCLGSSAGA